MKRILITSLFTLTFFSTNSPVFRSTTVTVVCSGRSAKAEPGSRKTRLMIDTAETPTAAVETIKAIITPNRIR